ncbi:hypothetical protein ONZ45_g5032 [Pleurotus djamor]|nr:hypothetical protein ONZ45_g5032 [Pleurotus djamor]
MFEVIRFLDHPLLPAHAPDDYPKIVKSGFDGEGQHPESPPLTPQCGLATLFHKIERLDLLEKLLDVNNVHYFYLKIVSHYDVFLSIYMRRTGRSVEVGFIDHGLEAMPGVRYRINEPAPGYRFGPWKGYATTDNLQPWGGTQEWIDGQGTYFAIAIWVNGYWDGTLMDLEFTGQTAQFDEEFEVWQVEHAERMKKMREDEAAEEKEMEEGSRAERDRTGEDYNTWRLRELRHLSFPGIPTVILFPPPGESRLLKTNCIVMSRTLRQSTALSHWKVEKSVRFLDHPLLPAAAPDSYPKIIKSGIDEEGQHMKSPRITPQCGLATLLYRMDRMDILEKLLDIQNTQDFYMKIVPPSWIFQEIYVRRENADLEVGFMNREGDEAMHGIRYRIEKAAEGYRFGPWVGLATSDLGCAWGGTKVWIDAQGSSITKAIWLHRYWNGSLADIDFTGKTIEYDKEFTKWKEEYATTVKAREEEEAEANEALKAKINQEKGGKLGDMDLEMEAGTFRHIESRKMCRAGCGVENAPLTCTKCRAVRYCSKDCQLDDWKFHKSVCGQESILDPVGVVVPPVSM